RRHARRRDPRPWLEGVEEQQRVTVRGRQTPQRADQALRVTPHSPELLAAKIRSLHADVHRPSIPRDQRTPSRAKARWSWASSSAMGGGEEGPRGAVDRALQRDVVGEILAALLRRRPVGPETAHMLSEHLGCREGRQPPAPGDLARPMLL